MLELLAILEIHHMLMVMVDQADLGHRPVRPLAVPTETQDHLVVQVLVEIMAMVPTAAELETPDQTVDQEILEILDRLLVLVDMVFQVEVVAMGEVLATPEIQVMLDQVVITVLAALAV